MDRWLKDLIEMRFVKKEGSVYQKLRVNFHLPPESPLFESHQSLLRNSSERHRQSLPSEEKYNFALTFSADEAARDRIQREFMKFLKTIENEVKAAPSEEIYGLSFDLFRWSYSDADEEGGQS